MTDPMLVPVGVQHMATDMFNTVNADIFAEFNKATKSVSTTKLDFGAFADGVAELNIEYTDNDPAEISSQVFGFVAPSDMATLRKNLSEDLKYVESFASLKDGAKMVYRSTNRVLVDWGGYKCGQNL